MRRLALRGSIGCVVCFFALATPQLWAKARFGQLKGTVQVYAGGKWLNATLGTKLENGTPIQTAYNSTALIYFSTGGQLALQPNTKIILNELPVSPGSNRDIYLEHGQVSAFVKKGDRQAPNQLRIRTPTITAGVRGSFIEADQVGKSGTARAIESKAYFSRSLPPNGIEMLKREMMKLNDKLAANIRLRNDLMKVAQSGPRAGLSLQTIKGRIEALERHNQQLRIALKVGSRELVSLEAKVMQQAANAEKIASLQKLAAEATQNGKPAEKYLAEIKQLESENEKLNSEVKAEFAKLIAMNGMLQQLLNGVALSPLLMKDLIARDLREGDSANITGAKEYAPGEERRKNQRPASMTTVGQTGSEEQFSNQNDDMKVGVGKDFQQLYNEINTVTQPTSTGLPTLKKL